MNLVCPADDGSAYPSLGPQVVEWMEEYLVFGPGDLRGEPLKLDAEQQGLIWRFYELFPKSHPNAGKRRFRRCALSLRKGLRKTELAAFITAAELHPDAPVRFNGWRGKGLATGKGVRDPFIPMVAYTEEQSNELAYAALVCILAEGPLSKDFDIGLERIIRKDGKGKAVSVATSPNATDGARTTFQVFDEPLALDTPIPTLRGWVPMGEIADGDYVFGRRGEPVKVVGASPVHIGRPCYRVTFAGGDSIVADASHRWRVVPTNNIPRGEVTRTTEQMYSAGVDTGYGKRWRVAKDAGYDGSEHELPIDPYVLGVWLGDGATDAGYIHSGVDDAAAMIAAVECSGFATTISKDANTSVVRYLAQGLRAKLRAAGLLGNKHIPAVYMFGSRSQRLALLQGLMDTDGHTGVEGTCTFVQKSRAFAESFLDLVRSLGTPASLCISKDARSRTGEMCKVHFSPEGYTPFRLERKRALCPGQYRPAGRWPRIMSIEPCESVPVRCIAVDSEDHLFLAGRGLRLTLNTHRMTLPRQRQAHQTMMANLPKRVLSDAWALETTTAPEPGAGSVAEATMDYAKGVISGKTKDASLFFFHRQASDHHDLSTPEGIRAAVVEASGPSAAWSNIDAIVAQWEDPTSDLTFLERVWTNRLVQASSQAFDVPLWDSLAVKDNPVEDDEAIVIGVDGSQVNDSTAVVATAVRTGYQWVAGLWERPTNAIDWKVPTAEVEAVVKDLFERYTVWRMYVDPPYWQSWISKWQGDPAMGEERVVEWWTNRRKPMTYALENFVTAMKEGDIKHGADKRLRAHLGNSRKTPLNWNDETGKPLWLIQKERPDSPHKIDAAMAAVLSWEARTDAIAAGIGLEYTGVVRNLADFLT